MRRGDLVRHTSCPKLVFKVVSPPSSNGWEYMVCERFVANKVAFELITDSPNNFKMIN